MDPISIGIAAVGLGLSIFGSMKSAKDTSQYSQEAANVQTDINNQEQSVNQAKLRQMELEGRRTQIENIRNMQRGRAMATQAAVSQGAQFGSGLQGGLAQVQDQGFWNMLGVNQALSTGREISGYNNNISNDRSQLAQIQAKSASAQAVDQGYQSIGGALIKAGPIVGQVAQGFGGKTASYGGNYSGTPGASNTGGLY